MPHLVYPNRDRSLRHIKRTQAIYLYGRFPQRIVLGMPCCQPGFFQAMHHPPHAHA